MIHQSLHFLKTKQAAEVISNNAHQIEDQDNASYLLIPHQQTILFFPICRYYTHSICNFLHSVDHSFLQVPSNNPFFIRLSYEFLVVPNNTSKTSCPITTLNSISHREASMQSHCSLPKQTHSVYMLKSLYHLSYQICPNHRFMFMTPNHTACPAV